MAGKMMNIGGDANDAAYRYKMPAMTTKIEGRGNGIKTVLVNIVEVSKALHTEASYTTKFFGMEVGALSKFDNKRNVGIVHGVHNKTELQKMLKKFIAEFILCPKCKLPELQWKVHGKKSMLLQKCASCGWKGSNSANHKVKTYIINHPPPSKKPKKGAKIKPGSAGRQNGGRRTKQSKEKTTPNKDGSEVVDFKEMGGDDDAVWSVDVTDEAVALRRQAEMETLAHKQKKNNNNENIDSDKKIENDSNNNNNNGYKTNNKSKKDKKMNVDSPAQILRNYVFNGERSYLEILDEIKRIALARKFDQKKKLQLAIEALCDLKNTDGLIASLKKYRVIFAQFTQNSADCKIFFGVLEEFVCRRNPDHFLPRVYRILEVLYDQDIVTEEDIILWADTPSDQAIIVDKEEADDIRKKAEPFVNWLKQANDSDSDGEDDGSEEDIE